MTPFLASGAGHVTAGLAIIAALGISAQWIAWRLKIPSILLLLLFGFAAGPGYEALPFTHGPLLDANGLFGELLTPLVEVCVALILYEGGLTLRYAEVRSVGRVVAMLVTVGALVTWVVAGAAGYVILDLPAELAILLGAVLIVTGPTVIGPLLENIRPAGLLGPVLRWEGIVIDPIGALAAVLALEVILVANPGDAIGEVAFALVKTVVAGGALGLLAAGLMVWLIERFWIPERLQNPASLALVVVIHGLSNAAQESSGLFAATVMGMILANQGRIDVRHIVEFKENLRVLIIGALFIVLAARVDLEAFTGIAWPRFAVFLVALLVVARPIGVLLSTIGAPLNWRERAVVALMAPRGIVAAAIASVFALTLAESSLDIERPDRLVALTFATIVGTVLICGVSAPVLARRLGVADQNPQGVIFVGATPVVRSIARLLIDRGVRVVLVDTNRGNITAARLAGLEAVYGNVLEDAVLESIDLRGIGRAVAMTPNEEVNTLVLQRFERLFSKANVFRIPVRRKKVKTAPATPELKAGNTSDTGARLKSTGVEGRAHADHGRRLFAGDIDLATLEARIGGGWVLRATNISEEFDFRAYRTLYGGGALMMFTLVKDGTLRIATADKPLTAEPGDVVIGLIDPDQLLMPSMLAETPVDGGGDGGDDPSR